MNKKLLANAIVATLTLPAAAFADSEFEVYGILYIEAGQVEEGNDAKSRQYLGDENGMGRIGVRGSHKVNEDLSVIGHAVWNVNVGDDGGKESMLTDRDHAIGLKGNWGTVRFGSFDGAYKVTGGAKYDAFASTALQARTNGGMATGAFGTTSYFHNAVQYDTPKFEGGLAGLRAIVQYSIDERERSGAIEDYSGAYNIGVGYKFLDNYEIIASTNAVDTTEGRKGNNKVGGSAKFGNFSAFAQYEDVSLMGTAVRDLDILFLGARYRMDKLMLVGQVGQLSDNDDSSKDQDYFALGGRYFFDKQLSAYFGYTNTSFDDDAKDDLGTFMTSLRYDFVIPR